MTRNKLIKNILGQYLSGQVTNSALSTLQIDKVMPKEFIQEAQSIVKQLEGLNRKIEDHFSNPDMQKILKKRWRETPKETRDNLKQAGVSVRSLTRQRRRKIGRPKKHADGKRGRPKNN